MNYTPDELATALTQLERPVTKRRLIDWAQKGLLPPPRPHGRGRGRGKVYRWEERDILHRACDVFDLLAGRRRAVDVLLPLWVLGYDVPVAEVQRHLLAAVKNLDAGLTALAPQFGDRQDLVSALLFQLEEQPAQSFPSSSIEAVLQAFIDPQTGDWERLLDELRDDLTGGNPQAPAWPDFDRTETFIAFVRHNLSVANLIAVVAEATGDELTAVHRDLRAVVPLVRAVANVSPELEPWFVLEVVVKLGPMVAIGELAVRRARASHLIDRAVAAVVDSCQLILTSPTLQAQLRQSVAGDEHAETTQGEEKSPERSK